MVILINRWSFGILLWETFTLGGTPYPGLPTEQLLDYLSDGKRMDMPAKCPLEVYTIMRDCWIHKPEQRPHFTILTERLAKLLEKHTTTVLNYWLLINYYGPSLITGWLSNWRNGLLTWPPDYLTDCGLTERPTYLLTFKWPSGWIDRLTWPTSDLPTRLSHCMAKSIFDYVYCGTLSSGFVLNYRMDIKVNDRMDLN